MKIIIVGNGKVGYAIASQLAGEHHDITMVDSSPTALHRAENALDVMCIQGNGSSISVLKEAGAQSADLVIAVTNLDETNLLCCFIAKKLGAGHTIARVRSTEYRRDADMLKKEIGLDMVINPDLAAAQEIARIVSTPSAFSVELSIPCITAVDTANALVNCLRSDHSLENIPLVDIATLYHRK